MRTDHSLLRHLLVPNSVNTRIWKWLPIMQGYNLDIQHILGKVNHADHLSQKSSNDVVIQKNKVRFEKDAFVQRIRFPENASNQQLNSFVKNY